MSAYSVTDLGAYSTRSSDFGAAINLQGDLVVSSDASVSSASSAAAFRTAAGMVRYLEPVAGDDRCEAFGVNRAGLAVGVSMQGEVTRAVSWRNGTAHVLTTPSGATSSGALDVNEPGEIVGYVVVRNVCVASIWIDGDWFPLATLPGADRFGSIARSLNNRGDVVGVAYSEHGGRAFLWQEDTGAADLGTLGGSWSDARSVNERGQVVGVTGARDAAAHRAFIWSKASGMSDLGLLPGGSRGHAVRINNRGEVVGFSEAGGQRFAAVLWSRGQCIDLTAQASPGTLLSEALAINDSGSIICRGPGRMMLLNPKSS